MILTGKEIADLAMMAGFMVDYEMIDEDQLETEITIAGREGHRMAYYTEYPEEGGTQLG